MHGNSQKKNVIEGIIKSLLIIVFKGITQITSDGLMGVLYNYAAIFRNSLGGKVFIVISTKICLFRKFDNLLIGLECIIRRSNFVFCVSR